MTSVSTPGPAPQGGEFRHAFMLLVALAFLATVGLLLPHGHSGDDFRDWLLAHPGLKVRAAAAADVVLAGEAVLMTEVLADVALAVTIAMAERQRGW